MNYYAQGGQAHGIKSFAQDLAKHGRYGDTMVAHINPQEAALLKAVGGSGTINPTTGLPEYWGGLGSLNPVKAISNAWGGVSKLPGLSAIDKGLVGIDKAVGKTIPGGWGTLGMAAASFVPGMTPMMMGGLGALNGSGVARGGKFNLQGAIMGGAMAYGMSNLSQALQSAGGSSLPTEAIDAANLSGDPIGALNASQGFTGAGADAATNFAYTPSGEMVPSNISSSITGAMPPVAPTPTPALTPTPAPSMLQNFAEGYGRNVSAAGRGLTNLTGMGPQGLAGVSNAAKAFGSEATLTNTALPIVAGGMGLAAADQQAQYEKDQQASDATNSADYNTQMNRINDAKARARQAVTDNPYQFAEGGEVKGYFGGGLMQAIAEKIKNDPSLLAKMQSPQSAPSSSGGGFGSGLMQQIANNPAFLEQVSKTPQSIARDAMNANPYQFAMGGAVNPPDDETNMPNQTPMQRLEPSSMMGYAVGGSIPGYAGGRFLSGGGDGLSDDIPAVIGGKQPAKLADGEFVISSDVVSNLGNGSSKAGAKKLYAMMDRVRQQAHGSKKQISKVNANKVLPA